ncbi:glycosyltransferase family 2 protein [Photobacterium carnosum]|uniref:glycosyltransferase family 2 protein n=1 Tax=Photobacterium carnosum TaxID=2023717 RepID=UPI001E4B13B9|nr:glycosyltransferase family 2 protein [Photobacterium carnosum]MCD9539144.1 glycosyltransferase [Photobacterium carnosum]MCF2163632.1 glycosyltransferase [Photobacterium carnosum]
MLSYPMVSIVMPCFNSVLFIEESICSVLNQIYTNWELIIVDDGSTDDSISMINKYTLKDNRVKFFKNTNLKGASGARNTGVEKSKGKYIAFLDSDDLWMENKLYNQINFMILNDISFSYSDYDRFFSNGYKNEVITPEYMDFNLLTYACPIGCLTVIIDKAKFNEIKFPYIEKEDYALWLILLNNGIKAYKSPYKDSLYRVQSNSLSSKKYREIKKQINVLMKVTSLSYFQIVRRVFYYISRGVSLRVSEFIKIKFNKRLC